jgi:two-component system phosphate regulon sensor histidine kinase PhoR
MLNAVVYSSCAIYYLLVFKGIFLSGSVLFFMNTAYFGAVIYIGGFLLAILLKHLDKVRALENNKKEYERVLLLRGISHDLKLPLSVIKLNNQIIEKYDLPADEIKDYAQTNLEATLELEKMTENINSYLSLKQISAAGETTSVKNCFEKMKHYYNFYNRYDNYKFTVKCADKDCTLDINPLHFSRMLYNLVDNAFKYNKNGVQVTASYKVDKELLISIEDNGIGMDKEEIDKVFEPFYRIDESRTNGGLGLGLSVVKEVIESLKGTIEIESEKGVGTKIIITIPFY